MIAAWIVGVCAGLALGEAGCATLRRRGLAWPATRRCAWWGAAAAAGAVIALEAAYPARRPLWIETTQFAVLAFALAPLGVLAAPAALARRAWRPIGPAVLGRPDASPGRTPGRVAGAVALMCFVGATVAWRLPMGVDALGVHQWWLVAEAATLVPASALLFARIIGSPPRPALEPRPWRIGLAAVSMWVTWIFAYAVGFTGHIFYPAYARGGAVGEQEWTVALLWAASACALVPTVFVNLVGWLQREQFIAEVETSLYRSGARARGHLRFDDIGQRRREQLGDAE